MEIGRRYDIGDIVIALESIERKLSNNDSDRLWQIMWEMKREVEEIKRYVSRMDSSLGDIHTTLKLIESNTDKYK